MRALVVMLVSATAVAEPAPDVVKKLNAIGVRAQPKAGALAASCTSPAKSDDLKRRAVAWIDQQFPDERPAEKSEIAGMELVFRAGCVDGKATFVSVGQDRKLKKGDNPLRRNFILRITGDAIEQVAARTSTFSNYWMEWADEGSYSILAMVDLDGDGAGDLVWSDDEQEGGSRTTYAHVSVRFATGKSAPIVRVTNLTDVRVSAGQLVLAGKDNELTRPIYACVAKDLLLGRCATSAGLQRTNDKLDAANQLANLADIPDHDLAASWLAAIGVKATDVLAALPATTPVQKAQRHVEAFLETKQLDAPFRNVFQQPHPEASAYFTKLAAQLGDKACTPTPLTDATRAKLTTWIGKQDKQPVQIELDAECGTYAWAAWNRKGDQDRTESLVSLAGSEPVRVAKFPIVFEQGPVSDHHLTSQFFQHGDVVIGVVIRNNNLAVIATDKIVAQSHGEISRYVYDRSWLEKSFDVIVDSGRFMHPTPTGIEKLDRDAVKDHETQRLALEQVLDNPASNDSVYLAALRTLGADAKLVAECKALTGVGLAR